MSATSPTGSKYRRIINVCYYLWFAMCSVLLIVAVALAILSALGLLKPEWAPNGQPETFKHGLYLAVACGLVNLAVIMFGRKYFKVAYTRLAELEAHERRGP